MTRWRHSCRAALAALPVVALVLGSTGCGASSQQGASDPVASGPTSSSASSSRPTGTSTPRRVLAETAPGEIRPDAPLPSGGRQVSAAAVPVRLQVPSIGVDTALIALGLAADGTMAVPASAAVAGWYTGGPAPGQVGPAVLAGHVDSRTGPGVFYRLRDLRTGDPIVLRRANGTLVRFSVTAVSRFAKSAFPTGAVYGPTAFPELRLVTCGGTFDASIRHYRDNVVVFARQAG